METAAEVTEGDDAATEEAMVGMVTEAATAAETATSEATGREVILRLWEDRKFRSSLSRSNDLRSNLK